MAKVPPPYMTSARTGAPLVTPEDERALRKLYQRQRKVLERAIAAQGEPFADKFAHLGNIELDFEASVRSSAMMNYLRAVLGEGLLQSTPFGADFIVRSGAFAAALTLTVLPPQLQEAALQRALTMLPDLLAELQANGRGLNGKWT